MLNMEAEYHVTLYMSAVYACVGKYYPQNPSDQLPGLLSRSVTKLGNPSDAFCFQEDDV